MPILFIILLFLSILLVIFTLQNSVGINLHVFFWEISNAPLVLVLICCIVLGYLLAAIYFYPRLWKKKKEYNKLIKSNSELKELHDLNHRNDTGEKEEINPEGIELDDGDSSSFFKD